jgi:capsular polysaccharide biosynthesis protein
MELRRYLSVLRRRIVLIVLCTVVAAAAGWFRTPTEPTYAVQAVIYVGARQLTVSNGGQLSSDPLVAAERITATFAEMLDSRPIAEEAIAMLGLDRSPEQVVGQTSTSTTEGTQLLRIRVTDADPDVARDLANAMADAFVAKVQTFEPGLPAEPGDVPALPAYVFERATTPQVPEPLGLQRNVAVAGLFGFLAAVAAAFLLEYLDLTFRSVSDLEQRMGLPVLGVIPMQRRAPVGRRA